jgi:hypothetical protein
METRVPIRVIPDALFCKPSMIRPAYTANLDMQERIFEY